MMIRVSIHVLYKILFLSKSLATESAGELLLLHVVRSDVSLKGELRAETLSAIGLLTSILTVRIDLHFGKLIWGATVASSGIGIRCVNGEVTGRNHGWSGLELVSISVTKYPLSILKEYKALALR